MISQYTGDVAHTCILLALQCPKYRVGMSHHQSQLVFCMNPLPTNTQ